MVVEKMNQVQYAKWAKLTQPAVSYRLNKGLELKGVVQIERLGRMYILHVDKNKKRK